MAAPSEVITHGTAQALNAITNEPTVTPTVKVAEISKKGERNLIETKNVNEAVVYVAAVTPKLTISFKGQLALDSGLGDEGPGVAISTVSNFAAVDRDFDPSVGKHILNNTEDSTKNLDTAANTSFDIIHYPHIA